MPAVMEAIDRMSPAERVETMEYLWAAMSATAEPEPPAWHGDVLPERRRRAAAGEEKFVPLEESMRQLREEIACLDFSAAKGRFTDFQPSEFKLVGDPT